MFPPRSVGPEGDTPGFAASSRTLVVRVKPGSRKGPLVEVGDDGSMTIYVQERAVDGKANDAVTKVLAGHLGVPRSRVRLVSGKTARTKRFRIE